METPLFVRTCLGQSESKSGYLKFQFGCDYCTSRIILEKLEQHIKYYNKEVKDCKKQIDYLKQEIKESLKLREQLFNKVKKS